MVMLRGATLAERCVRGQNARFGDCAFAYRRGWEPQMQCGKKRSTRGGGGPSFSNACLHKNCLRSTQINELALFRLRARRGSRPVSNFDPPPPGYKYSL